MQQDHTTAMCTHQRCCLLGEAICEHCVGLTRHAIAPLPVNLGKILENAVGVHPARADVEGADDSR